MTDLEKMKKLFDKAKIHYEIDGNCLVLDAGTETVGGYVGSMASFEFTKEGALLNAYIYS